MVATRQSGDELLLARVRRGERAAFAELVDAVGPTMLRLVRAQVPDRAVAEEVVQDAWVSVLASLDRFEGRSSMRTWICTIAINAARKRAVNEARSTATSALADDEDDPGEVERFYSPDHPRWANSWSSVNLDWRDLPEGRLLSLETRAVLTDALALLPLAQRQVFLLYDVEGWSGEEICNVLALSGPNQRVLLHRARTQLRVALESYFDRGV